MIKANELRIGNFFGVYDNLFNRVDAISAEKIRFKNSKGTFYVDPENANPIPLTPEILERCGFEKEKEKKFNGVIESYALKVNVKGSNENIIHFNIPGKTNIKDSESYRFGNYTVNGHWGSNNFKYLHQLQNLYQSLTGEELEINLKNPA